MKKTIFFDLDDTLINHTEAQNRSLVLVRKKHFPLIPQKEFDAFWSEQARIHWKLYIDRKLTFAEQRIKRMKAIWGHFGKNIDIKTAEEIAGEYLKLYEGNWRIFHGLKQYLSLLKNRKIPMGIISNGNFNQQIRKVTITNAIKFFDPELIIVSESVGIAKPDLKIFKTAQKLANKENTDIIYFGNDVIQDIEPAKKLGWQTVLVSHPKNIIEFIKKNFN